MTKEKRRHQLGRSFPHEGATEEVILQAGPQGQSLTVLSKRELREREQGCDHLPLSILHIPGSEYGCHWQAQEKHERVQEEGRVVPALWGSTADSPLPCYPEIRATPLQTSCYACLPSGLSDHGELPLQWPESRESWGNVPGFSWQALQQGSWLEREQYSPCRHSGEIRGRM